MKKKELVLMSCDELEVSECGLLWAVFVRLMWLVRL